jgi:peptide/nickel transport system substrate-binding protein
VRNGLGDPANDGFVPHVLLSQKQGTALSSKEEMQAAKVIINQLKAAGNTIPELTLTTNADYLDMAVFLQKAWKDVGIPIKIDLQTSAMLRQKRNEGALQLFRGSWIADYPDAESYLACFYGPYCSPFGPNYTHFTSEKFDALYRAIESGEGGDEQRESLIHQANELLNLENPVIPLYYDKSLRLYHSHVEGLGNDAANRLLLKRVRIKH